jgi:glyceraldehyde-3-phosphate dehydrogenase (NADP+)
MSPSDLQKAADLTPAAGLLIGGVWLSRPRTHMVRNPLTGEPVGTIALGSADDVEAAVDAAAAAAALDFPVHARRDVLRRAAARVEAQLDEYAWIIAREGSKTIREARREAPRAATILRLAAEEAGRLAGETLPFDLRPDSEDRTGYYFRVPVGIVGAITPFNDPLALAAHKAGAALAAGNAVVLKPATATPFSAIRLARDLHEAGLPAGRINVVTGAGPEVGEALARHPRVRMLSFTGGVETGERLTRIAGIKKLSMELGSNSPVIVMPDADLDRAVAAIAAGAFAQAGQNCLGVQRVLVHRDAWDAFVARFVDRVSRLTAGASTDEAVDVCAMITEPEAERVDAWIQEALRLGARRLCGGARTGALVPPTILADVPEGARIHRHEVYGPVVSLYPVTSLQGAIALANDVPYGLHAAIFTESLRDAHTAIRRLDFGAVIVNDSTDYRLDVMPFGGAKLSGIGREGVRFAMQEMTETRVACFRL